MEGVPFARHASGFTRDFEQLVAWLATRTDKTTIKRMVRIDWDTVGRIIARVCADELDADRLHNLFEIGTDASTGKDYLIMEYVSGDDLDGYTPSTRRELYLTLYQIAAGIALHIGADLWLGLTPIIGSDSGAIVPWLWANAAIGTGALVSSLVRSR